MLWEYGSVKCGETPFLNFALPLFPSFYTAQLSTAIIDAARRIILRIIITPYGIPAIQSSAVLPFALLPNMPSSADATAAITFIITFKVLMISIVFKASPCPSPKCEGKMDVGVVVYC